MGLFKPKWKSKDRDKRLEWIESASLEDLEILTNLALFDTDFIVQREALSKIDDEETLRNIGANINDEGRQIIHEKLVSLLPDNNERNVRKFILDLEFGSIWGDFIVDRSNMNKGWLLESWFGDDHNSYLFDQFTLLAKDIKTTVEALESWIKDKLENEESSRSYTYSTTIVLQILGLLDYSIFNKIISSRIEQIELEDGDVYQRDDMYSNTLESGIATLLRRAEGFKSKKSGNFPCSSFPEQYIIKEDSTFLLDSEISTEFELSWRIVKASLKINLNGNRLVSEVISGNIQDLPRYDGEGLLNYIKKLPKEAESEIQNLKEELIENNEQIIKEINERYSNYY